MGDLISKSDEHQPAQIQFRTPRLENPYFFVSLERGRRGADGAAASAFGFTASGNPLFFWSRSKGDVGVPMGPRQAPSGSQRAQQAVRFPARVFLL